MSLKPFCACTVCLLCELDYEEVLLQKQEGLLKIILSHLIEVPVSYC